MKTIVVIILLVLSNISFGQDTEMFGFINQYRKANHKAAFSIKADLNTIAARQDSIILKQDTVSHSKKDCNEIVTLGNGLPFTLREKYGFIQFLKADFNITYSEPKNDTEVNTLVKLYILYNFDQSVQHKAILLGDGTGVGFNVYISDKKKLVANYGEVMGKKYEYKNMATHYKVKFACVIDIK